MPWNGPLAIAAKKTAPALAAGNSVVLKPAPATPLTAVELGRIARRPACRPAWSTSSQDRGASSDRSSSPIRGSTRSVSQAALRRELTFSHGAAPGIKRVSLELGGKSPNVIFSDAPLDEVATSAVAAVFANSGQDCCARSRIIVQRSVFDEFVELLSAEAGQVRQGNPLDPATKLGSLISSDQRDRVLGYLERARNDGARLTCGGEIVMVPGLEAGNAISPAVVTGAHPDSEIATDEVFGPVATVLPFDDEAEAIVLANATRYGLSGSLWTRDIGRALRVAREIRTGLLSINSDSSSYIQAPFGGYRQSGLGKEQGLEGLYDFTEVKNVYVSDR